MNRFFTWLIVSIALLSVAAGAYARWGSTWFTGGVSPYRTLPVTKGTLEFSVTSTGTVQPIQSVQVGSFVSGPIQNVYVDFNSRVTAGQLLARIDPRMYQAMVLRDTAQLAHRKADLERVEALLTQARKNEERQYKLKAIKQSYVSEQDIDTAIAERKSLEAQLKLGQASIDEAQAALDSSVTNLGFTEIKAPVDGMVIDRKVDTGQTVASQFQTPVLFVVAPDLEKQVHVYASVDEADIGLIRDAQARKQKVRFTVDAYPDDVFAGLIAQVRFNPSTVQNVVTYTVVVEAPNTELKLLPGMTANLTFQVEERTNIVRVPNAALRFLPKLDQVREQDRPILLGEGPADKESTQAAPLAARQLRRHVWRVDGKFLAAIPIVSGLSDNKYTELISGDLQPGQELVIGVRSTLPGASSAPR